MAKIRPFPFFFFGSAERVERRRRELLRTLSRLTRSLSDATVTLEALSLYEEHRVLLVAGSNSSRKSVFVSQGANSAVLVAVRIWGLPGPMTAQFLTADGTAKAGEDFASEQGAKGSVRDNGYSPCTVPTTRSGLLDGVGGSCGEAD